jgi:SAM-dependent methyltransferase
MAEVLPFADSHFDCVISRYSAHHWHDVPAALREVRRVLKPDGLALLIDTAGGETPLLDTHLQAIEILRDPSHILTTARASGWRSSARQASTPWCERNGRFQSGSPGGLSECAHRLSESPPSMPYGALLRMRCGATSKFSQMAPSPCKRY